MTEHWRHENTKPIVQLLSGGLRTVHWAHGYRTGAGCFKNITRVLQKLQNDLEEQEIDGRVILKFTRKRCLCRSEMSGLMQNNFQYRTSVWTCLRTARIESNVYNRTAWKLQARGWPSIVWLASFRNFDTYNSEVALRFFKYLCIPAFTQGLSVCLTVSLSAKPTHSYGRTSRAASLLSAILQWSQCWSAATTQ